MKDQRLVVQEKQTESFGQFLSKSYEDLNFMFFFLILTIELFTQLKAIVQFCYLPIFFLNLDSMLSSTQSTHTCESQSTTSHTNEVISHQPHSQSHNKTTMGMLLCNSINLYHFQTLNRANFLYFCSLLGSYISYVKYFDDCSYVILYVYYSRVRRYQVMFRFFYIAVITLNYNNYYIQLNDTQNHFS